MADGAGPWPLRIAGLCRPAVLETHAGDDLFISRAICHEGIWEPFESALLLQCLQPGQVCLDAGANLGYFSVLAALAVGDAGRVFAFEPEPANFRLLQKNLTHNGLAHIVRPWRAGLSNLAGRGILHLHPDNLGDHQLYPDEGGRAEIAVDLLRGDSVLAGQVKALDFVKIDTQGAETRVVQGLMGLLRASGGSLRMLVELTPFSLRRAGSSGEELLGLLEALNLPFAIVDHIGHALVPVSPEALRQWCRNVDAHPQDRGFMNIFLGTRL